MHSSRVSFNLRLHTSVSAVARMAKALGLNFFQFFLRYEDTQRLFSLSKEDERIFLSMRSSFKHIYVHGSYLINMAINKAEHPVLDQEITLAKKLQISHYILHPGAIEKGLRYTDMLDRVVRVLNTIIGKHSELIFCVENTANPSALLGGALEDFVYIQERINVPERFAVCIDTAHAHAAGYALDSEISRRAFFALLIKYNFPIALVHLNDTREQCGSRVDCHAEPGKGLIGMEELHAFVCHPLMRNIPLLIEAPELSYDMMNELLNKVKKW
jgi:deoxyribonuclease IV